ncbi:unnamed protein product [Phaedon cochleariae]|uniref:Sulfatase N-terminal domain-containing protein n=1 Tax=Phaedon cochleariae TaxID=80249 RepID=A0A9P0DEV8_PHACE|nr:unnamed protein product [Phaedon cochleariae]
MLTAGILFHTFIMLMANTMAHPNFVLIITDDQDLLLDGLVPMKNTLKLIANEGKTFQNAFVNTPICCPSRSTILTGKYAHNTGVTNNTVSGNCSSKYWQEQHEPSSIAALLKNSSGYLNFYAGKYLNRYGFDDVGGTKHIPKGYDWWIGLKGNSRYYNYTLSVNGTAVSHNADYLTDVLAAHSLDFLENRAPDKPFFMTIAPPAPHAPFTPAKRHENAFPGTKALRTPSFNETPSDKHWLVGMTPTTLPANVTILDGIQQGRLESLLAVDELVKGIITKLKDSDVLDNTYIIFTSDNGFHIGQFTQPWDKRQPYETDIRIPFLISGPKIPKRTLTKYPVSAVDIAPTILDLADVNIPSSMDGKSFKSQLFSSAEIPTNDFIFVEYWGEGAPKTIDARCPWKGDDELSECSLDQWCKCQDSRNNTYSCIIELTQSQQMKFCEFEDEQAFRETYDLMIDPYELKNLAYELSEDVVRRYQDIVRKFKTCQGRNCYTLE